MRSGRYDAVIVGGGHNGLTAAAYLAAAGRSVLVLERDDVVGGAARSVEVFAGYGARLSEYSYLVSLLPELIVDELGLDVTLAPRRFSSYTPVGDGGVLVDGSDPARTRADLGDDADAWSALREMTTAVAERVFPTLTEPLRSADDLRRHIGDDDAWKALFERPLGEYLEERFSSDTVRGIILTDALVGTFASAGDRSLLANRCFLYHVIGRGTGRLGRAGRWDGIGVGGTGGGSPLSRRRDRDRRRGRRRRDGRHHGHRARLRMAAACHAGQVLANVAPFVLARLLGEPSPAPAPEGSQLKINMLLSRLPRLRDARVTPEQAFCGTFHINEGYDQLERAYRQAAAGEVPELPPCEVYCHSLTDPSILSPALRDAGAQTLTLFGLHMPARLFRDDPVATLARAREATLASVNSVLAEPIEDCLLDASTIETIGPLEVEANLGMPGGHIFHGDLQWPFAERAEDIGRWGVETAHPNVFVCGAGARRGGGVSGIPGRNAARAALAAGVR